MELTYVLAKQKKDPSLFSDFSILSALGSDDALIKFGETFEGFNKDYLKKDWLSFVNGDSVEKMLGVVSVV